MKKDASNPFHSMNEGQFEVTNGLLNGSTTTIVNGHNLYEEFCVRGKIFNPLILRIIIYFVFLPSSCTIFRNEYEH